MTPNAWKLGAGAFRWRWSQVDQAAYDGVPVRADHGRAGELERERRDGDVRDERVQRTVVTFTGTEQLLVQLLAGAQAGVDHVDALVGVGQ